MATRQFISLENLSLYNDLLLQVMAEEDAKSIKAASLEGKRLNLYTKENPSETDTPRFSITLPFTQEEIIGANGKAYIWNESDGGGIRFENNDGTKSFLGCNDGGAEGITAQIYSVNSQTKVGTRINVTNSGIYYTSGKNSPAYTADDEIATVGQLKGGAGSKTVYLKDESSGQSEFAKVYRLYQGSDATDMSQNTLVGTINTPKDAFIKAASIETVAEADVPYEGAVVGDKYIDIEVQNQDEHLYIPANSLVDIYVGGVTPELTISIDGNNEITAVINDVSITRARLASDVTVSLDLADTALQEADIDSVPEADIRSLFE